MEPFRYHVYVCDQRKPDGMPCCSASGSLAVIDALRRELGARGLVDKVQVTTSGSLGLCLRGPNLVVYPEGVWYSGVTPADVAEIVTEHFENGRPVARLINLDPAALKAEITDQRNQMLAALKARDEAGVVPDELMGTVRAFQDSRVLLSAVELDFFTTVAHAEPAATAGAVARACATDPRATLALLNALAAMDLLTKTGDAFFTTPKAKRFLVAGSKDDASMAIKHSLSLWLRWSTLTEVVRSGRPVASTEMVKLGQDWTKPFIAAMHRNAGLRAPLVVRSVGAAGVKRLLDVGGGSAAYSIAFAQTNPELCAEVFDLQTVLPLAEQNIAAAGLSGRVRVRVGDLRRDEFGQGYDLILLSAICHMLDPAENQDLLARVQRALGTGGRVVIQDHVMQSDKTAPRAGALFAINMLVGTPGGSTYSEAEYRAWLGQAGFAEVNRVALAGPNDLMIGRRL
jgi:(2Fe-2S) ferredoxin